MKRKDILVELEHIAQRLTNIEQLLRSEVAPSIRFTNRDILLLPDPLRRCFLAVNDLAQECTASEVAEVTGRLRAVESSLLNQLVRLGFLGKKRIKRYCYFYIKAGRFEPSKG